MNVFQMSVSAGVLILAILIIRAFAFDRLPKTLFIILWGIALGRLLIPFSIPLKMGFFSDLNRMAARMFFLGKTVNIIKLDTLRPEAADMGYFFTEINKAAIAPADALTLLWAAGAAVLLIFFGVSFYRSHREVNAALPIKDRALIDGWLRQYNREHNLKRPVRILVSDRITTPITYGIARPRIVLPKSMDLGNEALLRYVLAHEYIHIKRFDALWKLLLIIALCCHWYNPAVWALFLLMNRDMEIACDEKVVKLFGEGRKSEYAMTLIEMAGNRAGFAPLHSNFSKNAIEERIMSIMKFRKKSVLSLILAFVLVIGAASVFAESTGNTAVKLRGFIRTDKGSYSFDLDDGGTVSVKDGSGRKVSEAVVGSDGNATLTDGKGNVLKKIQLVYPENKPSGNKLMEIYGTKSLPGLNDGMLKFIARIEENGVVTVRDGEGGLVCTGTPDEKGAAVLSDGSGVRVGMAAVEGSRIVRLAINYMNMSIEKSAD